MNYITQSRLKSPVLWISLLGLISMILKDQFNITITNFDTYIETIISIFVGFGILNNPTSKDNF